MGKDIANGYKEAKKVFRNNAYNIDTNQIATSNLKFRKQRTTKRSVTRPNKSIKNKYIKSIGSIHKEYKKQNSFLSDLLKSVSLISVGVITIVAALAKFKSDGSVSGDNGTSSNVVQYNNAHMSNNGKRQLKNDEGIRLEAYFDTHGNATIGYGHIGLVNGKRITPGLKITQEQADRLFEEDLLAHENIVKKQLAENNITTPITQNMFDAMVNYAFNHGSLGPKFLKKLKAGDYLGAKAELEVGKDNQARMQRIRDTFGSDLNAEGKLKGKVLDMSTSSGVNKYAFKNNNVRVSDKMQAYLQSLDGSGKITSGMETTSGHSTGKYVNGKARPISDPSKGSHYYGLKIDVVPIGGQSNEEWAKTAIPFLRHPATEFVDFEAFPSKRFQEIKKLIFQMAPDVKSKCNGSFLKNSPSNSNTTAPHLDIKIKENYNYFTNDKTINKNNTIASNNINKTVAPQYIATEEDKIASTDNTRASNIKNNDNVIALYNTGIDPIQTYHNTYDEKKIS